MNQKPIHFLFYFCYKGKSIFVVNKVGALRSILPFESRESYESICFGFGFGF
jgi:hypothetical protein